MFQAERIQVVHGGGGVVREGLHQQDVDQLLPVLHGEKHQRSRPVLGHRKRLSNSGQYFHNAKYTGILFHCTNLEHHYSEFTS